MRPVRKDPPYSSSRFESSGYREKVRRRSKNPLRGKKWDDEFWKMKTEKLANEYSRRGPDNFISTDKGWVAFDKEDQKEASRLQRRYDRMTDRKARVKSDFRKGRASEKAKLAAEKFDRRNLGARVISQKEAFGADLLKNDPRFRGMQRPAPRF